MVASGKRPLAARVGGSHGLLHPLGQFGVVKQQTSDASQTSYFVAYGQGCRLRTQFKSGQANASLSVEAIAASIRGGLPMFNAEFDAYGFTKAYAFQVQTDDNGSISAANAMKSLVATYNLAIADAGGNVVDVPIGVWIPRAWTTNQTSK